MPIELGEKREDTYDEKIGLGHPTDAGETIYPKFCYRGPKDLDLPDCGTMVICYQKTTEKYKANEEGEHYYYECEITVKRILAAEEEKDIRPSKRDMSADDALDALAKAKSEDNENEGDEY